MCCRPSPRPTWRWGRCTPLDARLVPRHGSGRLRGRLRLELVNRGNEDLRVSVSATDDADDEKLHFAAAEGKITVPKDGAADAFLKVRPDRPILLGKPVDHPFLVQYARRAPRSAQLSSADDGPQVQAEVAGTWRQKPLIAKWMIVVAALVAVVVALVLLVNRARAVDPPRTAPPPPDVVGDPEIRDGTLFVTVDVDPAADQVVVQVIEQPPPDHVEDAVATGSEQAAENVEGSEEIGVELADDVFEDEPRQVYFRVRAVHEEQPSVWRLGSALTEAPPFDPPGNVEAMWVSANQVEVSWSPPENDEERTFAYSIRLANGSNIVASEINDTSEIIDFDDPTDLISVMARDTETGEPSLFSDPVPPSNERPEEGSIGEPINVKVVWTEVPNVVELSFDAPANPEGYTLEYLFRDDSAGALTPLEPRLPNRRFRFAMDRDEAQWYGISVSAVASDAPASEQPAEQQWSPATFPTGTLPPLPTDPPASTTTTTTLPPARSPEGFWILPQGENVPEDPTTWRAFFAELGYEMKSDFLLDGAFEVDVVVEGQPLFERPGTELHYVDGLEFDEAMRACNDFLAKLAAFAETADDEPLPTRCFVVRPSDQGAPIPVDPP